MKLHRGLGLAAGAAMAGAILALAACVSQQAQLPAAPVAQGAAITVQATPVPLDPADPSKTAIGDFRYAGGIALTSTDTSRLHGLSDLVVLPSGQVVSVSDDGDFLTARLVLDAAGRLTGLDHVLLQPLTGLDGKPLQGKEQGDAEGVTVMPDGRLLVSFEQQHRIWAYPEAEESIPTPVAMPRNPMAANDGMEGLTAAPVAAPDGYFVGVETGEIWFCQLRSGCAWIGALPRPPAGFRLSGLASGPQNQLVILHHRYIPGLGSRIQVTIVDQPKGYSKVIGQFAMGLNATVDNFEGVSVVAQANGDWRLYLLSDDNFNAGQRTLMLAFDWTPPK